MHLYKLSLKFYSICAFYIFCSVSLCFASAAKIKMDASIQWDDAHYQAKPDGVPMYLVTNKGLLIENSLLFIKDSKGAQHGNLLPWEMRSTIQGQTLSFEEPVKVGAISGNYRFAATVEDRALKFEIDLKVPDHVIARQTLNLPANFYQGQSFVVDGRGIQYKTPTAGVQREVILPRQSFRSFKSLTQTGAGFELSPARTGDLEIEVLTAVDWKEHRSYWLNLYSTNGVALRYTLRLPEASESNAQRNGIFAGNRLLNSSFELGREEWGVIFGKRDVSSEWSLVGTQDANNEAHASHGSQALRVAVIPQVAPYESKYKSATIASDYFQANPLEKLTISADLKSAKAGQVVKLQLRYVPTSVVPNRGSNLIEKKITLTKDWQRYSFDARLPLAAKNAYAIAIEIPSSDQATEVYIDAVAVRPLGYKNYIPRSAFEAHSDTKRFRRLYEPGEAFDIVSAIRNNTNQAAPAVLQLTLHDPTGNLIYTTEKTFPNIGAQSRDTIAWKLPTFIKQGMYRAAIKVGVSKDSLHPSHSLSLAVLRGRDVNVVDPDNRFGVNITDLREFWALERIGIGWSRFTFDCGLGQLMRQPGVWNTEHAAKLDALLDYQASFGVTPLAVLGPGMPKWASRAPKGSSAHRTYTHREDTNQHFESYINQLLDLADGRLYAIETWNEPDIPLFYRGTVQEMANFTEEAYDIIKAHSPEIEVVGLGLATPAETHNKFLRKILNYTGLKPYDAISYHPYTEGRRHPARGDFREVVQGIYQVIAEFGKPPPLWATEFGYFGFANEAKPFVPYKNPFVAREILEEDESAAAYIQAICTAFANGVDKTFYFTLLEGNLLDRWLQGWVGPGGRSVESGFIAAATACDLIRRVDCLGQEEVKPGLWQTQFAGRGKQFVVLWSENGDQSLILKTDDELNGFDLYGNIKYYKPEGTSLKIPLTSTPIYLNTADVRDHL
jgi:hypothetical protein